MCGIVGAVAERDVAPILMEGLKRLEYRGYDSAGIALGEGGALKRVRREGKAELLKKSRIAPRATNETTVSRSPWSRSRPNIVPVLRA